MDSKFKCVFLDLITPSTANNPLMANPSGNKNVLQNFDHDHLSDVGGGGGSGDDLVNGVNSNTGTMTSSSEFCASSAGSENTDNNNHHHNGNFDSAGSTATNGHHDDHMVNRNNNKKFESISSVANVTMGGNKQHSKNSEYVATSNQSQSENVSSNSQVCC